MGEQRKNPFYNGKEVIYPKPNYTFDDEDGEWFSFNDIVPYEHQHVEAIQAINNKIVSHAVGWYRNYEIWDSDGNDWNGYDYWRPTDKIRPPECW